MSADIIQFIPRSTKRRASIIPIEITAAEILKDDAFRFEDSAKAEYVNQTKEPA